MTPLDIGKDDIKALADDVLRELVAQLSAAQLRRLGRPVSGVRAGGRQEAKDGGIDVEVSGGSEGFLPRPIIGFQVKKDDYPPARIPDEMCPNGELRPSIRALGAQGSAYIIVSGAADLSALARKKRLAAMEQATNGLTGLHLDYYDSDQLARWVNEFPSIAAWVRSKLGRPVQGWKAFENWSRPDEGTEAPYLTAEDVALLPPKGEPVSVVAGIDRLREALSSPRSVVRLVGLSGLGKTRLVQALFDDRIGGNALDRHAVIYTDIGFHPQPGPQAMVAALAQSGFPIIVIVDNCPPETHRILAKEPQGAGSRVSILTVEYDVSDDTPEDTQVFRLQVGDEGAVPQLLERRRPDLPQAARARIAEFAGGNARLALALGDTVECAQSLAKFSDEDLLKRLFQQRQTASETLLRIGEACALVYSFHGDPDSPDEELGVLAELARVNLDDLHEGIVELQRRGLIQSRGEWRALLPQALAQRLARPALQKVRLSRLRQVFEAAPERLRRSFTRRLEMLHDAENAVAIAQAWLQEGGILGTPSQFGRHWDMRGDMFRNLAPVAPETALSTLVRASQEDAFVSGDNWRRVDWCRILFKLAYEPTLFERAAMTLARFLAAEPPENAANSIKDSFLSLFNFAYSGTHALIEQRLTVIRHLLSADGRMADCGLLALDRLLQTRLNGLRESARFGAHPRNYGFALAGDDAIRFWYGSILDAVTEFATAFPNRRAAVAECLARHFSGLWRWGLVRDRLEQVMLFLTGDTFWWQGWIAVRNTMERRNKRQAPLPEPIRLRSLEARLRPKTLTDRARAWVLSPDWGVFSLSQGRDWQDRTAKVRSRIRAVASVLAAQPENLQPLLTEFSQEPIPYGETFGKGLALSADPIILWPMVRTALQAVEQEKRNFSVAFGLLGGIAKSAPAVAANILETAVTDEVFGTIFPSMQASIGLDQDGCARLRRALEADLATPFVWRNCIWRDDDCAIPIDDLARLAELMWSKDNGQIAVLWMLEFRVRQQSKQGDLPANLGALARSVIARWNHWAKGGMLWDYHLADLVETVLVEPEGAPAACALAENILTAIKAGQDLDLLHHGRLVPALLKVQPSAVLNVVISAEDYVAHRLLDGHHGLPLDAVPPDILLAWASRDPNTRLSFLAAHISVFDNGDQLRPLVFDILDQAGKKQPVLDELAANDLYPRGAYSGERTTILTNRSLGLEPLKDHPHADVRNWATEMQARLMEDVAAMQARASRRDERFE